MKRKQPQSLILTAAQKWSALHWSLKTVAIGAVAVFGAISSYDSAATAWKNRGWPIPAMPAAAQNQNKAPVTQTLNKSRFRRRVNFLSICNITRLLLSGYIFHVRFRGCRCPFGGSFLWRFSTSNCRPESIHVRSAPDIEP